MMPYITQLEARIKVYKRHLVAWQTLLTTQREARRLGAERLPPGAEQCE
ncbi:hypothetical protein [Spirosoma endbachense]|uniref:Uncharacterized protein n=1 Tax=Spirosoma endbachense TaxID=2666025 RepID=A0A6P1VYC6_9BACT|nr:hypothetical protein [Spirosoma endbachense]QHV97775.1 hypothetical protein GJR95_23435 [Spirosoma endbachense]